MEISVQSQELIESLSERIGVLTVELETTRLALKKAQNAIIELEGYLGAQQIEQHAAMASPTIMPNEGHPVL